MSGLGTGFAQLAGDARRFARTLLTVGGNRLELLAVDLQEEREHLLQAVLLALGVAACAMLAGAALTAALVVALWSLGPLAILLAVAGLWSLAALLFGWLLSDRLHGWRALSATLDQIRKDRAGLERMLS